MTKREEILEVIAETIMECEAAIEASPRARRDRELTLVSSGFRIAEIPNDQPFFWAQEWRL